MTNEILIGGCLYDRTRALIDGRVPNAKKPFRFLPMSSTESTERSFGTGELDGAEVSYSAYLTRLNEGKRDYVALPVHVSRAFRHGAIFTHGENSLTSPAELAGKRIGMPNYRHTTPIWLRGILQDEYGVDWRAVRWSVNTPEGIPAGAARPPVIETIRPGESLWNMLANKKLDAVISMQRPPAEFTRTHQIMPLIRDYESTERRYHADTGCFPVMHVIAIRAALLNHEPKVVRGVYQAFDEARQLAIDEINEIQTYPVSLPWLPAHAERSRSADGSNIWSYGVANNLASLEPFERYSFEQGFTNRRYSVEELFPGHYQ